MRKIKIINGPNINMQGLRDKKLYGTMDYETMCVQIENYAKKKNLEAIIEQFNHEGDIIDSLHQFDQFSAIIINPAAYSHYSYAIMDALLIINEIPKIEVHISNIYNRENFRNKSVISPVVDGVISGLGVNSYLTAIDAIKRMINART